MSRGGWLGLAVVAVSMGLVCGCESGGGSGGGSSAGTLTDSTVGIAMGATYQTGVLEPAGAGTLTAHVKSHVGSTLKGWFIDVADASVHSQTTGADINFSVGTATGQTWRVAVFNPSGVTIDTDVTVTYTP